MESIYGLIGHPLGHSFSAIYFNDKFKNLGLNNSRYILFDKESLKDIRGLAYDFPVLKGLNVTIPYKKNIIAFIDSIDEVAKEIGAVNCISIHNANWIGYNTDALAFKSTLEKWLIEMNRTTINNALIFGSGGSSLAVQWALRKMGINYKVVSRQRSMAHLAYQDLNKDILQDFELLINTTPLGMEPNINEIVELPLDAFQTKHLLYDLIYNPAKTVFLKAGINKACKVKNGMDMLYEQAEMSWHIWNNN